MTPSRFDSAFQSWFLALFAFLEFPLLTSTRDGLSRVCEVTSVTGLDCAFGRKGRNRPPLSLTEIHIWICFSFHWHVSLRFMQLGIQFQSNLNQHFAITNHWFHLHFLLFFFSILSWWSIVVIKKNF